VGHCWPPWTLYRFYRMLKWTKHDAPSCFLPPTLHKQLCLGPKIIFISFPVYLNISTSCNGLEMVENDVYDNGTSDEHRFCSPIQSKTYEKNIQDLNYRSFVSELSNMWLESQSDCWF
jgi:hypothetical protein